MRDGFCSAILMHSLYEYVTRSDLSASMINLAEQWIAVQVYSLLPWPFIRAAAHVLQFNAVQDFSSAMVSGQQAYGIGWSPKAVRPTQTIIAAGQLAAAELFNVVLALPKTLAVSTPYVLALHISCPQCYITYASPRSASSANSGPVNTSAPNAASLASTSARPLGAIVGGVIGGLAGIALIVAAVLFYLRRRRRDTRHYLKPVKLPSDRSIDPYVVQSRATPEPASRLVLTADGTRVTKLQRERFAPGASEVYPYPIPPGSIDPREAEEGAPRPPLHVDPETLQRIVSAFQSIMARLQRHEERRRSRQRSSIRKEPLYGQGYDRDI
jgi:hypothetical protein